MKHLTTILDKIAGEIERLGMAHLAEEIDTVANSIEAANPPDTQINDIINESHNVSTQELLKRLTEVARKDVHSIREAEELGGLFESKFSPETTKKLFQGLSPEQRARVQELMNPEGGPKLAASKLPMLAALLMALAGNALAGEKYTMPQIAEMAAKGTFDSPQNFEKLTTAFGKIQSNESLKKSFVTFVNGYTKNGGKNNKLIGDLFTESYIELPDGEWAGFFLGLLDRHDAITKRAASKIHTSGFAHLDEKAQDVYMNDAVKTLISEYGYTTQTASNLVIQVLLEGKVPTFHA